MVSIVPDLWWMSVVLISLVLLLICLFSMLILKNIKTRAKLGIFVGSYLTLLSLIFIYLIISPQSTVDLSQLSIVGVSGLVAFLMAGLVILAWSILVLRGKAKAADVLDNSSIGNLN